MPQQTTQATRKLHSTAAQTLAELTGIFDDLQFVLGCCERLLGELAKGEQRDPVVAEALWSAALNAYARCFRPGELKTRLIPEDLKQTGLQGDVLPWHEMLGKLRNFLVGKAANPREEFSVGVTLSDEGTASGVVVTSALIPQVDETTVRQTGRLAYELGQLVDGRIQEQQKIVFTEIKDMPAARLNRLEPLDVDMSVAEEPTAD